MGFSLFSTLDKVEVLNTIHTAYHSLEQQGFFPAACGSISLRLGAFEPTDFYFAINHNIDMHPPLSFPIKSEFVFVDQDALPCEASAFTPSKEALLHAKIYRLTGCTAIIHAHTPSFYRISPLFGNQSREHTYVNLDANHMMISTGLCQQHEKLRVPVLPQQHIYNHSDLSPQLIATAIHPDIPLLVQQQNGVYIWGNSIPQVIRRLQAFEFTCQLLFTSEHSS